MNINTLQKIIKYFDYDFGQTDFNNLPSKDSEEYRTLLMKTANDIMFSRGRYSAITERTLEWFDDEQVNEACRDLEAINSLSESDRKRLSFYLDLKNMCYPLFRSLQPEWTEWPWNLSKTSLCVKDNELWDIITSEEYPCLGAAVLYDTFQLMWDDTERFPSVARQELSDAYHYTVEDAWDKAYKSEENERKLVAALEECATKFWFVENHIDVGKMLFNSHLEQAIYDALDTFIDNTYRAGQIVCAKEIAKYIDEHYDAEKDTKNEKVLKDIADVVKQKLDEHDLSSPSMSYTMNIIYDAIGVPLFGGGDDDYDEDFV